MQAKIKVKNAFFFIVYHSPWAGLPPLLVRLLWGTTGSASWASPLLMVSCIPSNILLRPLLMLSNIPPSACAVPGASSVSNDGYSVTFASGALSERLAAEAQGILSNALGSDPHGLLYRGCF